MKREQTNTYDVIVIGGGPAGMIAAATAAKEGKRVLLLEKNPSLGKKLLITGGGRCNVTNNKPVIRTLAEQYKGASKFLFSLYSQFGVTETIDWFKTRGVEFKEENEGRLFPTTDSARTIFDALVKELEATNVTIHTKEGVESIEREEEQFTVTTLTHTYICKSCIVASGGTSRPETGSTGEGYEWMRKLGHTIVPNNFALVPLVTKEPWVKHLAGITLPNIKITVFANEKKEIAVQGKLLFTHLGVTGPTVLNMSSRIGELLSYSTVTLQVDLFPHLDAGEMKTHLQNVLTEHSNKRVVNAIATLVPTALARTLCQRIELDEETPTHSVPSEKRKLLALQLKALPLTVTRLLGADKAVISGGGVALTEVDFKTMESKIVPRLFIIGDVLDIDRPSGGYSLQLCWSTGFVAGKNA